jgi:hypothetical protein
MSMSNRSSAMSIVATTKRTNIDELTCTAEEAYQNEVPRVRRRRLNLLLAICALALIGTACAFGYRDTFGGAALPTVGAINEPNRIAPARNEPQAESSGNARQVGATITGSIDNMISREAQPTTTIGPPEAAPRGSLPGVSSAATPAANQTAADPSTSRSTVNPTSQRAENPTSVEVTAALNPQRLAGAPVAASPNSTEAISPAALGSGYTVQVTSERSQKRGKLRFGPCKRNIQVSLAATSQLFAALISAPPASTIELLSAPSRQ